jgi:hypothetical protein
MKPKHTPVTFTAAAVADNDLLKMSASPDSDEPRAHFSRMCTFDEQGISVWSHHDLEMRIHSVSLYLLPPDFEYYGLCAMSDEGDVRLYSDRAPVDEKIPGAGVQSDDAVGWGYMTTLQQIGGHLYAAGDGGQVYQRAAPNRWAHMDEGLLQPPDVSERLLLSVLGGTHERALYVGGSLAVPGYPPFLFFWNGQHWTRLPLPEVAERLTGIHVESEQRIWLCGANGTLLRGNAAEGFTSLSTVHDNQLFLSLCLFQGRLYLGANVGLFVYDPANPATGIRKVLTGLQPELQDANIVDSADDVLWSIGPKDIARFDGQRWERIHHPDNPPIR